ncbi:MAG: DUF1064 domain-containing protein [Pontiella sp.]|nr:DUF1064 domain-containing protein [Pontiella sp.]
MKRFKTKHQAQNLRSHSWICLECGSHHKTKTKVCQLCGSSRLQYFPSQAEARRYGELTLKLKLGVISALELQPSFPIEANGILCATYRADFAYQQDGELVIEDVKPTTNERYLDPVFKLKRSLVEALHGVKIRIVKR